MKRIGVIYNARIPAAADLAKRMGQMLQAAGHRSWLAQADYDASAEAQAQGSDLIVSVGGDGTILRAVRLAVPHDIPILGVNMGKVGFMTELAGAEALERLPRYLNAEGWMEQRALLDVEVNPGHGGPRSGNSWALNEVVVGRSAPARVVSVEARVDGAHVTTYQADGVIVATATGSTAYALAAGGPVLDPQSRELLLLAVSPHLCLANPIVVHQDAIVELAVGPYHDAIASLDGHVDYPLKPGDVVRARRGPRAARFLRMQPRTYFYATLTRRLSVRGNG